MLLRFSLRSPHTPLFFFFFLLVSPLFAEQVFIDEIGREVIIKSPPERIISLAPNITEILFAIGADGKLVGVTDFCDFPEVAKKKEKVGGFVNPSIEKIILLKPDLVFATKDGNSPEVIKRLINVKIPVYIINPRDFEGVINTIRNIARITERIEKGEELTENIERRAEEIYQEVQKKRTKKVLFLYGVNPMIAAGRNTFADNLISRAGGENVLSDSPVSYPKVNLEEVLLRSPDFIIMSEMDKGDTPDTKRLETLFGNRVKRIDGDLVNRPGPRMIQGLEELYRILHSSEE